MVLQVFIFLLSFALSVVSSWVLAKYLSKVVRQLALSEGLQGILTALAADAPEISAAVFALLGGQHELGFGVVLGSNIFNLAALLGLSVVIVGRLDIRRASLVWNGVPALLVVVIAMGLLLKAISPILALVLMGIILVPYAIASSFHANQVKQSSLPESAKAFLSEALSASPQADKYDNPPQQSLRENVLVLVPSLVSILMASVGMVNTAQAIGGAWGVPSILIGTLVLAVVTGIPNVVAAIRLARRGRGAALVSETLNSNTLNLLVGMALPALVLGLNVTGQVTFSMIWLLGMTVVTLLIMFFQRGLGRWGYAYLLIALYVCYIGIVLT